MNLVEGRGKLIWFTLIKRSKTKKINRRGKTKGNGKINQNETCIQSKKNNN